jgi:3',5'-cyclic AMP phosphodiesterase CpdA
MASADGEFLIAQVSDIHCGESRFDDDLIRRTIHEVNRAEPDLVVIPGDLTANGFRDEFVQAKRYIDDVECEHLIVIAGNHDCRNVGYLHFEEIFGARHHCLEIGFGVCCDGEVQDRAKILAADSNKPDLNDGELGRAKLEWIDREFADPEPFKIFVLHHHVVSVPGTGRERNILLDAGDVVRSLSQAGADLILSGHKHVPWATPVAGMLAVTSGTAGTHRTRGKTPPSYNLIRITEDRVEGVAKDLTGENDLSGAFDRARKLPVGLLAPTALG